MEIKQIKQFPREVIEQLLAVIPFYKAVKQQDEWQFEQLLSHSRIVNFTPGEVVLRRGDRDTWLYFLLKGRLAVFAGDDCEGEAVNYITPGEVFGDLAMLTKQARMATVVADTASRQVMVFATNFQSFGELEDFTLISLATKLAYFRNTVHNLRWKLEEYRMKYPQSSLADKHRSVRLYTGAKDCMDELLALQQQGQALARLIGEWNRDFGALPLIMEPDTQLIETVASQSAVPSS